MEDAHVMTTNATDGQFCLDCWVDPESEEYPDHCEYSENVEELRALAGRLIKGGRFKFLRLSRWNADATYLPDEERWDEIEVWA
jgi:hypothetical protein